MIEEIASTHNYDWKVELVNNPDKVIAESDWIAITSDAWILDNSKVNFNLMHYVLKQLEVKETIIESKNVQ